MKKVVFFIVFSFSLSLMLHARSENSFLGSAKIDAISFTVSAKSEDGKPIEGALVKITSSGITIGAGTTNNVGNAIIRIASYEQQLADVSVSHSLYKDQFLTGITLAEGKIVAISLKRQTATADVIAEKTEEKVAKIEDKTTKANEKTTQYETEAERLAREREAVQQSQEQLIKEREEAQRIAEEKKRQADQKQLEADEARMALEKEKAEAQRIKDEELRKADLDAAKRAEEARRREQEAQNRQNNQLVEVKDDEKNAEKEAFVLFSLFE